MTDMLGNARIHNATVDIGATELSLPELEVDATTPDTVDEGSVFTLVLDYSDPDDDAVAGWTIDWGDETETTDTIADGWLDAITDYGNGAWTITHIYADDGEYDIEITVTDEHGASTTRTAEVKIVENHAPAFTDMSSKLEFQATVGDPWRAQRSGPRTRTRRDGGTR